MSTHAYMPDLDLKPHEYGTHDPKTGRLRKEMSPQWHRNWLFVSLLPLGYIFWHRAEIEPGTLFGGTLVFGIGAGMALFGWLRNIY